MKKDTDSDFDTDPEGSMQQSNRQLAARGDGTFASAKIKAALESVMPPKISRSFVGSPSNMLKQEDEKARHQAKQLNASWDHAYLLRLLGS